MLSMTRITGMFANCGYDYDVIMEGEYELVDFIKEAANRAGYLSGDMYYIKNGKKVKVASYNDGKYTPLHNIKVVEDYTVTKAKAKEYDDKLDFYCFIGFYSDTEDATNSDTQMDSLKQPVTKMNVFSENSDDTLSHPEWQLDRKALDFIHDAEATGSYLKQIDMIDAVDSIEFSKAIMKRLFEKLNRLRGHK